MLIHPIKKLALPRSLAALLAACAGGHPQLLDPSFDFGDVASYAWKEAPRFDGGMTEGEDDELRWRVDDMVDALVGRLPE